MSSVIHHYALIKRIILKTTELIVRGNTGVIRIQIIIRFTYIVFAATGHDVLYFNFWHSLSSEKKNSETRTVIPKCVKTQKINLTFKEKKPKHLTADVLKP